MLRRRVVVPQRVRSGHEVSDAGGWRSHRRSRRSAIRAQGSCRFRASRKSVSSQQVMKSARCMSATLPDVG